MLLSGASAALPAPALVAGAAFVGVAVATWNGGFMAEVAVAGRDEVAQATSAVTFFTLIGSMMTPPLFALLAYLAGYRLAYLAVAVCVPMSAALLARAPAEAGG